MNVIQWTQFAHDVNDFTAAEAAARLCGLARWWMSPQALEISGTGESPARLSDLPADSGDCWILCVNGREQTHCRENGQPGLLRPEFLLPLTWVEGCDHGTNLPPALIRVARHVVATMQADVPELRRSTWGLRLYDDPNAREVDLGQLDDFDADSAWASLAAALWCKATNSLPDRGVWATGCWRTTAQGEQGIWKVQEHTLPRKLRLFHDYQARQLFVPLSQADEAREELGLVTPEERRRIGSLHISESKPLRALGAYLADLKAEPDDKAPFDLRREHYLTIHPLDAGQARSFRERCLFGEIVERCRTHFEIVRQRVQMSEHPLLVTIASAAPELISLAVEATHAAACLILYDQGPDPNGRDSFLNEAQYAAKLIAKHKLPCDVLDPVEFSFGAQMDDTFRSAVQQARERVGERPVVFDLTPANKLMTEAMAQYVAGSGDWLLYLTHVWRKDLRIQVPGTERFLLRRQGDKWDFDQLTWEA